MRKQSAVLLISVVLLSVGLAVAQVSAAEQKKFWTAQWITAAAASPRDEAVLHFRKVIELTEVPQHFMVDVTADNQFSLYVNQKMAGMGPSRSDLGHWRYETYDLAPFLRPGKNVVAATVWNFGTHAAVNQMSNRIAFLVRGHGDIERVLNTDATWEVEQEKGASTLPVQIRGYYAAEPGLRMDAAKFDWSWNSEGGAGPLWTKAVVLGR